MPENALTLIRDDSPAMIKIKAQAQMLAEEIKDLAGSKPGLLTMRSAAQTLKNATGWVEFIDGTQLPGVKQKRDEYEKANELYKILLRLPLDLAFGQQRGLNDIGGIKRQLELVPKRAIADSKNLIEQKKLEERRALEDAQRKEQEASRRVEVKELEASGRAEAAADLKAAPLPPVVIPVAKPVMPEVSTTQRYLVEGIEVDNIGLVATWLATQRTDLIEKLIEVRKGGIAAYLNATAGAEIPGIKAIKSDVVVDRRK